MTDQPQSADHIDTDPVPEEADELLDTLAPHPRPTAAADDETVVQVPITRARARRLLPPRAFDAMLRGMALPSLTRTITSITRPAFEPVQMRLVTDVLGKSPLTAAQQAAFGSLQARTITTAFDRLPPSRIWTGMVPSPIDDLISPIRQGLDLSGVLPAADYAASLPPIAIDQMVPRIDLSAHLQISKVMRDLHGREVFPAAHGLMQQIAEDIWVSSGLQQQIASLFAGWHFLERIGHSLAGLALVAARRARRAVLQGDTGIVAEFAVGWLGLAKATDEVIEAVSSALLEDDWLDQEPSTVIGRLSKLTTYHRRVQKPLWKQALRGGPVHSLDAPLGTGDTMTFLDILPAPDIVLAGRIEDPRLVDVLDKLTEDERMIVEAKGDDRIFWGQAAERCGLPAERGEALRRKVKYLIRKISGRGAAA